MDKDIYLFEMIWRQKQFGLIEQLDELQVLLENDTVIYNHGYTATELQKMLSMRVLPEFIEKDAIKKQLIAILSLASDGLEKRGYGDPFCGR